MVTLPRDTVHILGVPVDTLTVEALHAHIYRAVVDSDRATFLHVNVHCLNLACVHPWLRTYLNEVDLVICDGKGVQIAARWLGGCLPVRITYADWMWQLAAFAATHDFSFYFLGGRPGVAARAARALQARWPQLRVLGCHHGYFDQTLGSREGQQLVAAINQADPDILLTAFGMPRQERWLSTHRPLLRARTALAGGAVFDYLAGDLARGPDWMTQHGWEWLARLCIEPRRLWRRYLLGNPLFVWRVLQQRLTRRGQEPES